MKKIVLCLIAVLIISTLTACNNRKVANDSTAEGVNALPQAEPNEVTTIILRLQPFEHELISNGKVEAIQLTDIHFETDGIVEKVLVRNGDHVAQGQVIAELDKFKLHNAVVQAQNTFEQAKLDLQDVLIGQGYGNKPETEIPSDVMQLARTRSGYSQSLAAYELALSNEANASLKAPFSGTIANLQLKRFNKVSPSDIVCTIVGSQGMEATFSVLENELPLVHRGDKVVITPYADITAVHEGIVTEINPIVDANGMVQVKAQVRGSERLFSGMNIKVSVRREMPGQLVVPKSSVVLRQGRQVVFTLQDDQAMWNYVQTGLENADTFTILEGLKEGDEVIVTGNVNLAHESKVRKNG
ncbi:MAG: efflux RND transporter periplasmic adaptor subunit [Bacteroidaceae bacterium]|nr:efflux RND transporter periplasmic adaptor subunit [Bacteroidaceae bacterium]